ncbi:hypothetical protein EDEG_03614 [Edhazardia aedis USNM 41457]|uniref:Uncharacterized protein n=1 Tax=Edhazardia aedis (strain USNM 41457) TaxID=1003232 RepID=J9D241_EDHAE|nr:hypothetical protein EDEG_03614 [Edhazardia aedis USNM 41457]|eukprot:EJW01921.1 hypothetical protein EDEG_03614 [Edhazardia aedis USNM 41457]
MKIQQEKKYIKFNEEDLKRYHNYNLRNKNVCLHRDYQPTLQKNKFGPNKYEKYSANTSSPRTDSLKRSPITQHGRDSFCDKYSYCSNLLPKSGLCGGFETDSRRKGNTSGSEVFEGKKFGKFRSYSRKERRSRVAYESSSKTVSENDTCKFGRNSGVSYNDFNRNNGEKNCGGYFSNDRNSKDSIDTFGSKNRLKNKYSCGDDYNKLLEKKYSGKYEDSWQFQNENNVGDVYAENEPQSSYNDGWSSKKNILKGKNLKKRYFRSTATLKEKKGEIVKKKVRKNQKRRFFMIEMI